MSILGPIKQKIRLIVFLMFTILSVLLFSTSFSLAAQMLNITGAINIVYTTPLTLMSGPEFINVIPEECRSIVFDCYSSAYYDIINNATTITNVATQNLTLDNGGIRAYYMPDAASLYVLSNNPIVANENCSQMFQGKSNLSSIQFNSFDTSNVRNMSYMFALGASQLLGESSALPTLSFPSSFDTSNVIDMSYMFYGCTALTGLDVSNFDTSKVTNMSYMFYACKSLTSLDISEFNTSNVTNMSYMFSCGTQALFGGYGIESALISIRFPTIFTTGEDADCGYMFYGCTSLTSLDLTGFDTSKVKNMSHMFDLGTIHKGVLLGGDEYDYNNLASITFGPNFKTSNVTDMSGMFYKCTNLISLDLSGFDTSNVTNMSNMFYSCASLTMLNVSSFNTSNVTDMSYMFSVGMKKLHEEMYGGAYEYYESKLQTIIWDENKFVTTNVQNMSHMFDSCTVLESLNLSTFDTSKVTDISYMFNGCGKLSILDLSSFNTSKVVNMERMFTADLKQYTGWGSGGAYGIISANLNTIYVGSNWDTSSVTTSENMFYYCNSLVGGEGTAYNSSNANDVTYAIVDGGTVSPGYLTFKN